MDLLPILKLLVACVGGVLLLFLFVYAVGLGIRTSESQFRHPPAGHFFWPTFPSPESAQSYCTAASFIPFLFTAVYAVAGWFGLFGYGPWVWAFCVAFAVAGFAMRRGSRAGVLLALGSYLLLVGFQVSRGSLPSAALFIFGVSVLVNGLRASVASHASGRSTAAA